MHHIVRPVADWSISTTIVVKINGIASHCWNPWLINCYLLSCWERLINGYASNCEIRGRSVDLYCNGGKKITGRNPGQIKLKDYWMHHIVKTIADQMVSTAMVDKRLIDASCREKMDWNLYCSWCQSFYGCIKSSNPWQIKLVSSCHGGKD